VTAPIRLSADELLDATLERQGLAARHRAPAELADAVERFGPLHATDRATPYLSLLARLDGFGFADLDRAWLVDRRLDRRSAMRGTFHLVPRARVADIVCMFGTRRAADVRYFRTAGIEPATAERLAKAIAAELAAESPLDLVGMKKALPARLREQATARTKASGSTLAYVVRWMAEAGVLAAAPRRDRRTGSIQPGWQPAPLVYEPFERAFGRLPACDPVAADAALAGWYFAAHGPAAYEDWAWWTNFPARRARAAFEVNRAGLVQVEADSYTEPLFVVASQADDLARLSRKKAGRGRDEPTVRLLPYEDSGIKAYRTTRGRFFDPKHEAETHTLFGEVLPTILVDGRIEGTWSSGIGVWAGALQANADKNAGAPKRQRGPGAAPYGRLDRAVRRALDEELERVASAVSR
jgi:hypothetical protein